MFRKVLAEQKKEEALKPQKPAKEPMGNDLMKLLQEEGKVDKRKKIA